MSRTTRPLFLRDCAAAISVVPLPMELLADCYDAGWSFGGTGDRYYFRVGRVAMTQAAHAGMRAEGRRWYSLGIADGAADERATRRRVGGEI